MKQVFTRICVLIIVCLAGNAYLTGQNVENNMNLIFSRNTDGKVGTMNAVGQKVFDFVVDGISNQQQADDFVKKFKGKEKVFSVTLSVSNNDNSTNNAVIIMNHEAKIPDFKKILKDAGFSQIFLDGDAIPVDQLDILKSKNHNKK